MAWRKGEPEECIPILFWAEHEWRDQYYIGEREKGSRLVEVIGGAGFFVSDVGEWVPLKEVFEALKEIENHACMRETLRQISVQPCDPSRHDEQGSVCSPCHAKSYFNSEANDPKA